MLALLSPRCRCAQQVDGFLRRDRVGDVAEVDGGNDLLGGEVGEQAPDGHAPRLCPEIPDGVHDRRRREVDDALLGSEPAELVLGGEAAPEAGEVAGDALERAAHHERLERTDRGDADLGATAVREREPMARKIGVVGIQDHVRGGVVRAAVHRVRPVERARGREADVVRGDADDLHVTPPLVC